MESRRSQNKEKGDSKVYLREKRIKILKIKNVILAVIGIFCVASSVFVMVSLVSHYHDDLQTVLEARATPDCVKAVIIGVICLLIAGISRRLIEDANFYSGYFEGDLSGYISYGDLAEVTGKSADSVKRQLHIFRKIYMKGYEPEIVNHTEQVVLNSKKCICECKHCGAPIEKRIYFTGVCPYCGSSDLFARVLTGSRFYSIGKIMDNIIWGAVLGLAFVPVAFNRCKKIKYISVADDCSQLFAGYKTPFVNAENLPVTQNKKRGLKAVRGALRQRYLQNCTLEKHDGVLKVALAKKIVKDQCPSCGGAIVGAVDEHYKCRYCGNVIMGVIHKK